jgi:hypothetical protein
MPAPAGYTTVSARNLKDASNTKIDNATIHFRPVLNSGKRTSFRDGGDNPGQASLVEVTAQVQAGAFSKVLADMNLTDPKFIGYQTWVIHNITGELLLGPGYECVQWPQDDAFDFDTYRPNFTAQAPITVIDGLVFKGDYSDIQSYVFGDVVYFVPDGSSYVSLQYNNVAKTPGVDDEWWSLLAKRGAQGSARSDQRERYGSGVWSHIHRRHYRGTHQHDLSIWIASPAARSTGYWHTSHVHQDRRQ